MNTLEVVIIVVVVVLLLLALGGYVANHRRTERLVGQFDSAIERANQDLAQAHAKDRGWDPAVLEAAARTAFAEARPADATVEDLALVAVVDPPGTDDDKAEFRVVSGEGEHLLTLGRRGDDWILEQLK